MDESVDASPVLTDTSTRVPDARPPRRSQPLQVIQEAEEDEVQDIPPIRNRQND